MKQRESSIVVERMRCAPTPNPDISFQKIEDYILSVGLKRINLSIFSAQENKRSIQVLFSRIVIDRDEDKQRYKLNVEGQVPIIRDEDKGAIGTSSFTLDGIRGKKHRQNIELATTARYYLLCQSNGDSRVTAGGIAPDLRFNLSFTLDTFWDNFPYLVGMVRDCVY